MGSGSSIDVQSDQLPPLDNVQLTINTVNGPDGKPRLNISNASQKQYEQQRSNDVQKQYVQDDSNVAQEQSNMTDGRAKNISDIITKTEYIQDNSNDGQTQYEQDDSNATQSVYQQGSKIDVSRTADNNDTNQLKELNRFRLWVIHNSGLTTGDFAMLISKPFEIRLNFDPSYKVCCEDGVLKLSNKKATKFTVDAAGHLSEYDSSNKCFVAIIDDDNVKNSYIMEHKTNSLHVEKFFQADYGEVKLVPNPMNTVEVSKMSADQQPKENQLRLGVDPAKMKAIMAQETKNYTKSIDEIKKELANNALTFVSEFRYDHGGIISFHEAPRHFLSVFRGDVPNIKYVLASKENVPLSVVRPENMGLDKPDIGSFVEFDIVEVEPFSSFSTENVNIFKIILFLLMFICFSFVIYRMYRDYYEGVKLSNGGGSYW